MKPTPTLLTALLLAPLAALHAADKPKPAAYAEQFAGWYSQAVHWIKKNSKPVKLKNGDIQYRVNSPSPWWKFW